MNDTFTPPYVSLSPSCRIFRTRLPTTPYHQPSQARSQRNTCPQARVASRSNGWSGRRVKEGITDRVVTGCLSSNLIMVCQIAEYPADEYCRTYQARGHGRQQDRNG